MIQARELAVRYSLRSALAGVDLQVDPGEFVLLTGPSGCGKSTLARCLNGLIPHTISADLSGELTVDGRVPSESSVPEMARSVGLVLQNPATQLFGLTVEDEVAFGPRNLGLAEKEVARRVTWALEATDLDGLRGRTIHALSGGEQQRLAIAAVLAMGPRLLVLDEPTSSLDAPSTRMLIATLARLNREAGVTVVIFEHRLREAARVAQRLVVMDGGQIAGDGSPQHVLAQRSLLLRLGLRRPADEPQDDWTALLVPKGPPHGAPVVELRGVEAGYGPLTVLRELDLTLYAGEFAALVGDNGAGKSTVARLLAGLLKPRRGEVRLAKGWRLVPGRDVGLLFQNPLHQLFTDTVVDEVRFGPENLDLDPAGIEPILAATDLDVLRERPIHALSVGQQQRTALAAILALQPSLVILDEPTMGQDWRHLRRCMEFLVELNRAGCTVLLITHDCRLVYDYAQRVLLLQDGQIVADGAPAAVTCRE